MGAFYVFSSKRKLDLCITRVNMLIQVMILDNWTESITEQLKLVQTQSSEEHHNK